MLWLKLWFLRRFLNFVNAFSLIRNYLPFEKDGSLYLNKIESSSPKFGLNWPSGSGEKDIYISSMYCRYLIIISPWKMAWPFICINLILFHPRMLCANFGLNWPSGSGEEEVNVKSLQELRQQCRR